MNRSEGTPEVKLTVDGRRVSLKPFPTTAVATVLMGFLRALDGLPTDPTTIDLSVRKSRPDTSRNGPSLSLQQLDRAQLIDILRRDKAEFERIRAQDPRAEMDLSDADLSGCDLAGVSLAGITMRNASLRNADCTGTLFRFGDLSGADLRGAKLEGANFHQTELRGANLEGAALGEINRDTRLCLHASSFRGTRWSRDELERMLQILNENESWEIRYDIVPKGEDSAG